MNLGRMTTKKRAPRPILLKLLKPELKRSERYGAGEADLCFGPLVLAEDLLLSLASTWVLTAILIPVPGDPLLSSNLDGYQA